jgi:hemerythrin-like domain-containing protein
VSEPGTYETVTSDMIAVHRAILRALDDAPRLIDAVGSDPERHDDVVDFYTNIFEFLHFHHAGEDELLYPKLEERCPEHLALLETIDAQHAELTEPMTVARAALAAWTPESVRSATALVDAINAVDGPLRIHLSEEETNVLPIASKWVSPEEWDELRAHGMGSTPPDKLWIIFGLISEQLTDEAREHMLSHMPVEVRTVAEEQWQPMFVSYMSSLRG